MRGRWLRVAGAARCAMPHVEPVSRGRAAVPFDFNYPNLFAERLTSLSSNVHQRSHRGEQRPRVTLLSLTGGVDRHWHTPTPSTLRYTHRRAHAFTHILCLGSIVGSFEVIRHASNPHLYMAVYTTCKIPVPHTPPRLHPTLQ